MVFKEERKKLTPEEYTKRMDALYRYFANNPDLKDYRRTIAGRGDTHALEGGDIDFTKRKEKLSKKTGNRVFVKQQSKLQKAFFANNPDIIDSRRTILGRGDTHALDLDLSVKKPGKYGVDY